MASSSPAPADAGESPPPSPSPLPAERFLTPKKFVKLHADASLEDYFSYLKEEEAACKKLKEKHLSKAELRDVNVRLGKVYTLRSNDDHIIRAYKARADRLARDDRKERKETLDWGKKSLDLVSRTVNLQEDFLKYNGCIYDGVLNPGATASAVENDSELLLTPKVQSTASVENKKPKKIRDDKNKGSRVTAFAGKKRSYADDDEESEDDECTALERSMVTLSAEYAPGSNTFSEECEKLWQNYLAQVERRRMSPNSVQAQRGRHQTLMAEWYAADTAFAEFFVNDMAKKYETATIAIDRSAAHALTLGPISADLTAFAPNFNILSTWDKLWSRKADFPEQFISSVAAGLFVDNTASAAPAFEVEGDTKLPATRILSDIVAFLGTKLTFALELAHNLGNGNNKSTKVGVARSDFAITSSEAKKVGRAGAAVLIAEFAAGADAWPVHKDTFVATAEAVYESHRLLGHLPLADVSHARMHIVLCSDRVVKFQVIQPIYRLGGIFFERNTEGPVFDLSKSLDFADRLANALRMARYVQDVVFQDAYRLREKITASVQDRTVELLPTLPTKIPPQRPPGAITPMAKRRKT
ncbi:hypothetical protein HDU87_001887 [Geranomyces variabilis]|uniref:Uncharacterized protein n=1 Tax=Geranomyces variabilis TaxID=109894 RepID=A0AAD5TAU9_9FUNG|nr:hypothetical protein HDU87_001887 [Geranomyces variabilis]